jgi:hypothetical protein
MQTATARVTIAVIITLAPALVISYSCDFTNLTQNSATTHDHLDDSAALSASAMRTQLNRPLLSSIFAGSYSYRSATMGSIFVARRAGM